MISYFQSLKVNSIDIRKSKEWRVPENIRCKGITFGIPEASTSNQDALATPRSNVNNHNQLVPWDLQILDLGFNNLEFKKKKKTKTVLT